MMLISADVWLAIGGWVGSALVIISLTQARVLRFRMINLVGAVLASLYNVVLGIWPFVAMNVVIAVIDVYWLIRLYRERQDAGAYDVIQVNPGDAYLRHLLGVHLKDIRTFQPDFNPEILGPDHCVFVVLRGDETVGVVAMELSDDGVGLIALDYVTERFRDLTPAEFVYRRSGVLAKAGLREVRAVAEHRVQADYYRRVGFRLMGQTWVWTVAAG